MRFVHAFVGLLVVDLVLGLVLFSRFVSSTDMDAIIPLLLAVGAVSAVLVAMLVWAFVFFVMLDGETSALPADADDDRLRPPADPPAMPVARRGDDPWTPASRH